jgi:cytochrome c553
VPPCEGCHGHAALDTFPRLRGQNARYLENQLHLWRRGLRANTAAGAIMAVVAARLDERDSRDVALYYEQLGGLDATEAGP